MKYGIWRHENALGNSAEQVVNLNNFIQKNNDDNPVVYVETQFQRDFALCIDRVKDSNIHFYPAELDLPNLNTNRHHFLNDIHMPDVYFRDLPKHYPSVWADLKGLTNFLNFPYEIYENKFNLPSNALVLSVREYGTYDKRVDGACSEPIRFVNPETFFRIALHFADKGIKVIRVGDKNQTPFPKHDNIIDFALYSDRRMLDDLYAIAESKVFLSCDSGVWPIAAGMKKNIILSNVAKVHPYNEWLPEETSTVIYKKNEKDNTFDELITHLNKFF